MDLTQFTISQLRSAEFVVGAYLQDITDAEMMVRPCPDANHLAWQLGHCIESEWYLMNAAFPGAMPALPSGFKEQHSSEAARSDDPKKFLTKEAYLRLARQVREATIKAVARMKPSDLDQAPPPNLPPFIKNVGDLVGAVAGHWFGHAGQWVVLRRTLGRPRLF